jgi:hypothetical protein
LRLSVDLVAAEMVTAENLDADLETSFILSACGAQLNGSIGRWVVIKRPMILNVPS